MMTYEAIQGRYLSSTNEQFVNIWYLNTHEPLLEQPTAGSTMHLRREIQPHRPTQPQPLFSMARFQKN